jgi:hypothetical protein
MAGGGVPGGTVVGSSDKHGALPQTRPINPTEFAATIYHLMGIEATSDQRIRTFVRDSLPVRELVS